MKKNNNKNLIIVIIILLLCIVGIIIAGKVFKRGGTSSPVFREPTKYDDKNFNLNLIKTVNSSLDNSNYLISPYSIEIALNMLKTGANGNTLKEIEELIPKRDIKDVSINKRIGIANGVFIKDSYKNEIEKDFMNTLKKDYNSEVIYDKFENPDKINDWVNNKTNNMIPKILDDISKDFVLGLANAIAIDVEWYGGFECNKTSNEKFTLVDNSSMEVEMMNKSYKGFAKYFIDDKKEGVILPYQPYDKNTGEFKENGKSLEFVAVLPKEDIKTYINNLTEEELAYDKDVLSIDNDTLLKLSLPRFSYSFDLENFMDVLKTMGMNDAFDSAKADFTKILKGGDIYVSKAIHKTYIDLNEKGTKAAAVTYFGIEKNAMQADDERKIVKIEFNKPFIYMIRDKDSKEILFFGTVYEPNKWKGTTCNE